MTAPSFDSVGSFTQSGASFDADLPAGTVAGDFLLLLEESANEGIPTPDGWTEVSSSPQGTGTAATAGAVRLAAFYQFAPDPPVAPTIADTGDHTSVQILKFNEVNLTNPINITAGSVNASASTGWTLPAVVTTSNDCMVVLAVANDRDAVSTTNLSSWTNGNLSSLIERIDQTSLTGRGGGLGCATGVKTSAGNTGTTSVTNAASNTAAFITIALNPLNILQTLTATLFTNSNTFYTETVIATYDLTATLFENVNTFFTHTIETLIPTIGLPLFVNINTFYSATIAIIYPFVHNNGTGSVLAIDVTNNDTGTVIDLPLE